MALGVRGKQVFRLLASRLRKEILNGFTRKEVPAQKNCRTKISMKSEKSKTVDESLKDEGCGNNLEMMKAPTHPTYF